jgi:DNA-binding FrmR family transcriptional regulator
MVESSMAPEAHLKATADVAADRNDLQIPDAEAGEIIDRLKRVEGQIRAVQRLIAEKRDCHLIAQQLSAAKVALSRASVQLMATRMVECVRQDEGSVGHAELKRLTSTFMKMLA